MSHVLPRLLLLLPLLSAVVAPAQTIGTDAGVPAADPAAGAGATPEALSVGREPSGGNGQGGGAGSGAAGAGTPGGEEVGPEAGVTPPTRGTLDPLGPPSAPTQMQTPVPGTGPTQDGGAGTAQQPLAPGEPPRDALPPDSEDVTPPAGTAETGPAPGGTTGSAPLGAQTVPGEGAPPPTLHDWSREPNTLGSGTLGSAPSGAAGIDVPSPGGAARGGSVEGGGVTGGATGTAPLETEPAPEDRQQPTLREWSLEPNTLPSGTAGAPRGRR